MSIFSGLVQYYTSLAIDSPTALNQPFIGLRHFQATTTTLFMGLSVQFASSIWNGHAASVARRHLEHRDFQVYIRPRWIIPEIRAVTILLLAVDDMGADTTLSSSILGVWHRMQGVLSILIFEVYKEVCTHDAMYRGTLLVSNCVWTGGGCTTHRERRCYEQSFTTTWA
jgi:hypothetical protein